MSTQKFKIPKEIDQCAVEVHSPKQAFTFAIEELSSALGSLGIKPSIRKKKNAGKLFLILISFKGAGPFGGKMPKYSLGAEEYIVENLDGYLCIAGGDKLGLLYGIYAFMEELGFIFGAPGKEGVFIPGRKSSLSLNLPLKGSPFYPIRQVLVPSDTNCAGTNTSDGLDFLSRVRINRIFITCRNASTTKEICKEAKRRGMTYEIGAHILPQVLMPREEFEKHPEYFRSVTPGPKGKKSNDYNCCTGTSGSRNMIAANARKFAKKLSGAAGYHFWPDDIPGGGWCKCPTCKHLTPSEQSLVCSNAASNGIPDGQVVFIAYNDTVNAPERVQPNPNTYLLFAPRERCYAHRIGDPDCPRNRHYSSAFKKSMELFGNHPLNGLFEYYIDGILFRNMVPPMTKVISEDLLDYRRLGAQQINCHFGSTRGVLPVELLNIVAFGKMAYDKKIKPEQIIKDYAHAFFGSESSKMASILTRWEETIRESISYCGYSFDVNSDYLWIPGNADGYSKVHEKKIDNASRKFKKLVSTIEKFPSGKIPANGQERLAELKEIARITLAELEIWHLQAAGQNQYMLYVKTGSQKALSSAAKLLAKTAEKARTAIKKFKNDKSVKNHSYESLQNFLSEEMDFLAKRCQEELKNL